MKEDFQVGVVDVDGPGGPLGALEGVSIASDVAVIGQAIGRVREALAGAIELTDVHRVRIRNRARAWVAELDLPHLHGLQVEMSILVQDAERAIGLAAEPMPAGRPRGGSEKCLISDQTFSPPGMSRDVVLHLRSIHTRLSDEQYAEVGERARESGTLLSRRAVKRKLDDLSTGPVEEGGEPEVPPPTRSPRYQIEEGARRLAKAFAKRHDLVACAVVAFTGPHEPIVREYHALYGSWEVDATVTRVRGSDDVGMPIAPAERALFWADLMRLAGEWMRRTGLVGPVSEEEARRRANALYHEEFGRWPKEDGLVFNPGVEPASPAMRERARRRFREYHERQSGAGNGKSDSFDNFDDFLKPFDGPNPGDGGTARA